MMLGMLAEVLPREYPTDYLLSRLCARGEAPVASAGEAGADDSLIWQKLQAERRWLYNQLNSRLRRALAPLFAYSETGTIAQALRFQAAGQVDAAASVLEHSMLAGDLQTILRSGESVAGVLIRLEHYFQKHGADMKGLGASFEQQDLRRSEELLRGGIMKAGLRRSGHGTMTAFLIDLVDMRNLLVLARRLRWKTAAVPVLLAGGRLKVRFSDEQPVAADLIRLVKHWRGGNEPDPEQLHPVVLERVLQSHLLRKTARLGRLGDPVAACIEYLWRLLVVTRRQSMRLQGCPTAAATESGTEGR